MIEEVINITVSNTTNISILNISSLRNCTIIYHPVNEFALVALTVILVMIIANKICSKWIYGADIEGVVAAIVIFVFAILCELNWSLSNVVLYSVFVIAILVVDYIFG